MLTVQVMYVHIGRCAKSKKIPRPWDDSIELRLVSEMAAAGFESVPTFTGKAPDSFGGVYKCSEA